ncbi:hypothetical protein [Sphingorhabdus sp.]|uniref:hypothetical protein n=1 Tax=Sphingorhabdus sp. TaxID=1902408 RepID=UPI003593D92C
MNNLIKNAKSFILSVSFLSLMSRSLFAISQFLATFFAIAFFSNEQQAMYFLFLSILSIQTIFELGISQVIVILISRSHNFTNGRQYLIQSDTSDIIFFGFSKFKNISIAYFVMAMLLAFGTIYLNQETPNFIIWFAPWALLLSIYTLRLFLILLESIVEGFGRIADVLIVRSIYYSVFIVAFGIASYTGLQLWSLAVAWASAILTGFLLNSMRHSELLRLSWDTIKAAGENSASARSYEVTASRFHGKVSVTWVASYAISSLPLLIAYTIASDGVVTSLGVASQISAIIGVIAAAISSPHISAASNRHSKGDSIGFIRQFKRTLGRTLVATILTAVACFSLPIILRYQFYDRWPESIPSSTELLPFLASALIYSYMACVGQFFRSTQREVFNFPLVASAVVTVGGMAVAASTGSLLLLGIAQLIGPVLIILPVTLIKHHQLISQKDQQQ